MQKKLAPILSILLIVAIVVAAVFGVQKNDLSNKTAELEKQLAESKTTADGLSADVAAAKKSLETVNADLAAAKDELAAASTNLETSTAKVAELEAKVAELTAQAETAAADLAAEAAEYIKSLGLSDAEITALKINLGTPAPATGDAGVAVYMVMALVTLCGAAVLVSKKREII